MTYASASVGVCFHGQHSGVAEPVRRIREALEVVCAVRHVGDLNINSSSRQPTNTFSFQVPSPRWTIQLLSTSKPEPGYEYNMNIANGRVLYQRTMPTNLLHILLVVSQVLIGWILVELLWLGWVMSG